MAVPAREVRGAERGPISTEVREFASGSSYSFQLLMHSDQMNRHFGVILFMTEVCFMIYKEKQQQQQKKTY